MGLEIMTRGQYVDGALRGQDRFDASESMIFWVMCSLDVVVKSEDNFVYEPAPES